MVSQRFRPRSRTAPTKPVAAAGLGLGYPVVLKLHSETITHKTDVGGVRLNWPTKPRCAPHIKLSRRFRAPNRRVIPIFLGVTVQPMVRAEGYELILGIEYRLAVRAGDSLRGRRAAR